MSYQRFRSFIDLLIVVVLETFKDPVARKMRLVRRARENSTSDSSKVLKGMTDLAKEKDKITSEPFLTEQDLKPKRWDEALEKPSLDYSDFFEEDIGLLPGITVWEIENFLPNRIDEALHGKFYEGDCYIVLKTTLEDNQNLDWQIFYWIGSGATLDKKACSAIHAVNLRNFLGAHCRTVREEQGEESEQFIELFPSGLIYMEGGRTASGFFTVEEVEFTNRMFRLHELANRIYMEAVPLEVSALDQRFIFLVDTGFKIYVWNGKKSKNTMKQKARLLAEKINKEERKSKSELIFCNQDMESEEFWLVFGDGLHSDQTKDIGENTDPTESKLSDPILYRVCLGMGYLELPQIYYKPKPLTRKHFETKNVYIMDCFSELFVWYVPNNC